MTVAHWIESESSVGPENYFVVDRPSLFFFTVSEFLFEVILSCAKLSFKSLNYIFGSAN